MERDGKLAGEYLLWEATNLKEKFSQVNLEELRSDRIGIQTQVSLTSNSSDDQDPFIGERWLIWCYEDQCLG